MSDETKSIHEFNYSMICEYFSSIERQGPGSKEATIQALGFIRNLTDKSAIADIGCGTGGQTITLAQNAPGHITAVDLFPSFIDMLGKKAAQNGLQERVKGIAGSMDKLPFKDEEFDLIWSEGAIYNIGFERGLKEWRRFLKPQGYIAVSEASWFTDERPEEIHKFWKDAYSEIDTIPNKISTLQRAGYIPVAAFALPENCWVDNYYIPQIEAQKKFLEKYPNDKTALDLVNSERHEADLYQKYSKYYGYVFYIAKKF